VGDAAAVRLPDARLPGNAFATVLNADAIEFSPEYGLEDVFVCGTYQLREGDEGLKVRPVLLAFVGCICVCACDIVCRCSHLLPSMVSGISFYPIQGTSHGKKAPLCMKISLLQPARCRQLHALASYTAHYRPKNKPVLAGSGCCKFHRCFSFSLFSTLSTGVIVLRAIIRALCVFKCGYILECMGVNSGVFVLCLLCVAFLMVAFNLPVFTPKLLRCACPSCLRLCINLAVFSQNEEVNTERGAGGVSSHELDNPRVKGVCADV